VILERVSERIQRHSTELVDRHPVDDRALVALEPLDGVDGGMVFAARHEDPGAGAGGIARPEQALHGQVHSLRAAGGEDDLDRITPQGLRDTLPRLLQHPLGVLALRVD
jgi:hypothetical protein